MKFHGTMEYIEDEIAIGGIKISDLVEKYESPIYVVDQEHVEKMIEIFKRNFTSKKFKTKISYASKAFLTIKMAKLINAFGLSIDTVSGGEMYTAYKSGFPMHKLHLHGNNKTNEELLMAIDYEVGEIILDNENEIYRLEKLCKQKQRKMDVLLRIDPGIDTHTHKYIRTSSLTSKFGISIFQKDIFEIIKIINQSEYLNFKGVHTHIGSQIFELEFYMEELKEIFKFLSKLKKEFSIDIDTINIGGGFGIYYSSKDYPEDLSVVLNSIVHSAESLEQEYGIGFKTLGIEPGRSIIGNAGSTIYTVGDIKDTVGGKKYAFIDGGMSDNIRPALYQAEYECSSYKKSSNPKYKYTIAGKLCESGDILISDVELPELQTGDYLVVSSTGAYCYTMSSNYNRVLKPAVIFVKDGKAEVSVKRETYDDLVRNDIF